MPLTKSKMRTPEALGFNTLDLESFNQVTLGASVASTTIQSRVVLPCSSKVVGVISYASAVTNTLPLSNLFNIAIGEGAYQTGTTGVPATASITVASPTTGNVLAISFGGATFSYTVKSTDTTATILANSICQAWQSAATEWLYAPTIAAFSSLAGRQLQNVISPWNAAGAGVLVFSTLTCGTLLNGQTITCTSSGATTITASATLAGGANSTGITTPPADTVATNGAYNYSSIGQALFANDCVISGPAPGYYGNFYEPTGWDSIIQQGSVLTLRASTGAGGAVTNWNVCLLTVPYDSNPTRQSVLSGVPGATFTPGRVIF